MARQVVVVGPGKLGMACAQAFLDLDDAVVLGGRALTAPHGIRQLMARHSRLTYSRVDVGDIGTYPNFFTSLDTEQSPLVLILCASGFWKGGVSDGSSDDLAASLNTTFGGNVTFVNAILQAPAGERTRDIVLVAAYGVETQDAGRSSVAHIAAKSGLAAFAKLASRELVHRDIRVCSIAPATFAKRGRAGIPVRYLAETIAYIVAAPRSARFENVVIGLGPSPIEEDEDGN